jgi:hypothetical protein
MRAGFEVVTALALPAGARVDKRVPKKILTEQGAFAGGDKRKIQEGVEELVWVAALKPSNIAVAEYRDDTREYLEIAVLLAVFRKEVKKDRLVELIHRAIPYPVMLVVEQDGVINFSLVHKRASEGEYGKVVLDGEIVYASLDGHTVSEKDFLGALSISGQPSLNLLTLYQGWIDKITAFNIARITGSFLVAGNGDMRLSNFKEYEKIQARLKEMRVSADKESQMNRRVEINLEIQRLESKLKQVIEMLKR